MKQVSSSDSLKGKLIQKEEVAVRGHWVGGSVS